MQLRCISLFCPFQEIARTFHPCRHHISLFVPLLTRGSFFLAEEDCISMHSLNRSMHGPQVRLNGMHATFKIQIDMKPWHDLHIIIRFVLCVCLERFGSKYSAYSAYGCVWICTCGVGWGGRVCVGYLHTTHTLADIHSFHRYTHTLSRILQCPMNIYEN